MQVIFFTDGYYYGGKRHDCTSHVLPIVQGVAKAGAGTQQPPPLAVVVPYWGDCVSSMASIGF
jgi:hypothetical protein